MIVRQDLNTATVPEPTQTPASRIEAGCACEERPAERARVNLDLLYGGSRQPSRPAFAGAS